MIAVVIEYFPEFTLLDRSVQANLPIRHQANIIDTCLVCLVVLPGGEVRWVEFFMSVLAAVEAQICFDARVDLLLVFDTV